MDAFEQYCIEEDTNLENLDAHKFRRTFGSILYSRGAGILSISKLMGHANVQITSKLYVRDDMNLKRKAVSRGV